MGLDGQKIVSGLKHLSQAERMKQVEPLSYALFPGYHCPLMGAMLTIRAIKNAVLLVLGPDECAYYTKMATSGNGAMSADGCQIVSVVLEQHDVTFGCQEKLEEAFAELDAEYHPEAVFLVTTCVPEITGDDVESMADGFTDQYGYPVMVVHAENFKTDDHLPGIEHTLEACIAMMEPQECDGSVNVLGLRLGDFTRTEVYRVLKEENIPLGMQLPGNSSVEEIRQAAKAKVNLVVHPVGLPLAKKMKKKFGVPYVDFQRFCAPEHILQAYQDLFSALERPLPEKIGAWYREACDRTERAAAELAGETYFSGNTALCTYEFHSFLTTRLGLKALLLQISDLSEADSAWREEILSACDPYVTRSANIGPLQYLYPVLKPDYNIGAGNSAEMRKCGTKMVRMPRAYNVLGFETNEIVISAFLQAKNGGATMNGMMGMTGMAGRMGGKA